MKRLAGEGTSTFTMSVNGTLTQIYDNTASTGGTIHGNNANAAGNGTYCDDDVNDPLKYVSYPEGGGKRQLTV